MVFVAQSDVGIVGFATMGNFRGGVGYAHEGTYRNCIPIILAVGSDGRSWCTLDHAKAQGPFHVCRRQFVNPRRAVSERLGFEKVTTLREVGRQI